jgi:hypothetical protein
VGFRQHICLDLMIGGDLLALNDEQAAGVVDFTSMELKHM